MYQLVASAAMLELFPDSARIEHGRVVIGGLSAAEIAERFGTPLVVYCEETLLARAGAYLAAAAGGEVLYSLKAFPNVEIARVLADKGLGAEVSTLGELAFARRASIGGDRIVFDGNNKSDDELEGAAKAR